jgi:hypothetical protein
MENKQRWYPSQKGLSYEQWNIHRQSLDLIYGLQDKLSELHGKHEELQSKMSGVQKENGKLKEIINNRVAGRLVKPTDPSAGDTLRYNSTSGQFEFGP